MDRHEEEVRKTVDCLLRTGGEQPFSPSKQESAPDPERELEDEAEEGELLGGR